MPSFRGVPLEKILRSLDDGLYVLAEYLNPGPETEAAVALWLREADPLTRIAQARTDAELADAMGETGAAFFFQRFHEVFSAHALMETKYAFQTYRGLAAWGAFDYLRPLPAVPALDRELGHYVICSYVQNLSAADLRPDSLPHVRLEKAVYKLRAAADRGDIPFAAADFVESDFDHDFQLLHDALIENEDMGAAFALLDEHDAAQRLFLKAVLREMNGMSFSVVLLQDLSPLMKYRMVLPQDPFQLNRYGDARVFLYDFDEILDPYYRRGEALGRAIGPDRAQTPAGEALFFVATAEAARKVAGAFPQLPLFNARNERIPPGPPPDMKRLPGPRPPGP